MLFKLDCCESKFCFLLARSIYFSFQICLHFNIITPSLNYAIYVNPISSKIPVYLSSCFSNGNVSNHSDVCYKKTKQLNKCLFVLVDAFGRKLMKLSNITNILTHFFCVDQYKCICCLPSEMLLNAPLL